MALLGLAIALIIAWWPDLSGIWRDHALTFAIVTGLMAVSIFVQAHNFMTFLRHPRAGAGAAVSRAWAIGALVNYLGPLQPGLAVRVGLLVRLGIPVAESSVATLRQVFASLWLALLVAGVSLIWLDPARMAIPAFALILAFVSVPALHPTIRRVAVGILTRAGAGRLTEHAVHAIALPSVRSGLGLIAQYTLGGTVFYIGYSQFGVDITPAAALGLATVVFASSVVALLPGNFGVLEALCTVFGQVHGLPVEESLALAFLYRGANLTGAMLVAAIPVSYPNEGRLRD